MHVGVVDDSATTHIVPQHLTASHSSSSCPHLVEARAGQGQSGGKRRGPLIVDCEVPHSNGIDFVADVAAAATDALSKPVDPLELRTRVRDLPQLKAPQTAAARLEVHAP